MLDKAAGWGVAQVPVQVLAGMHPPFSVPCFLLKPAGLSHSPIFRISGYTGMTCVPCGEQMVWHVCAAVGTLRSSAAHAQLR